MMKISAMLQLISMFGSFSVDAIGQGGVPIDVDYLIPVAFNDGKLIYNGVLVSENFLLTAIPPKTGSKLTQLVSIFLSRKRFPLIRVFPLNKSVKLVESDDNKIFQAVMYLKVPRESVGSRFAPIAIGDFFELGVSYWDDLQFVAFDGNFVPKLGNIERKTDALCTEKGILIYPIRSDGNDDDSQLLCFCAKDFLPEIQDNGGAVVHRKTGKVLGIAVSVIDGHRCFWVQTLRSVYAYVNVLH